jgi:hypothetical protein
LEGSFLSRASCEENILILSGTLASHISLK